MHELSPDKTRWDLTPFYANPDDQNLQDDLGAAHRDAQLFRKTYHGQVNCSRNNGRPAQCGPARVRGSCSSRSSSPISMRNCFSTVTAAIRSIPGWSPRCVKPGRRFMKRRCSLNSRCCCSMMRCMAPWSRTLPRTLCPLPGNGQGPCPLHAQRSGGAGPQAQGPVRQGRLCPAVRRVDRRSELSLPVSRRDRGARGHRRGAACADLSSGPRRCAKPRLRLFSTSTPSRPWS